MNGENPYAPPAVAETEAPSTRYWRTYGTSLYVRNGTTLPKIDLETGAADDSLRAIQRILKQSGAGGVIRFVILLVIYNLLTNFTRIDGANLFIYFIAGSLILERLWTLRGSTTGNIRIWTFSEERRVKRAAMRRTIRIAVLILLSVSVLVMPMLDLPGFESWMLYGYLGWLGLMLALAIWSLLDRPKFRLHAAEPGWLRITPVHADALAQLRKLEASEPGYDSQVPGHKRLVRTVFYHRFPLRLLIGQHLRNPFIILRIALMKLLRSRLLVRDSYHFSEAEDVALGGLVEPLREAALSWITAHPGWTFVSGDHLTSPAGDLTVETASLASPDLAHCLLFTRAWMEQSPSRGTTHLIFITWLGDGTRVRTHDHPFLRLADPAARDHQAKGNGDQVFQIHLRNIAGKPIAATRDVDHLKSRLFEDKKENDRLLTERGYQTEAR